jgi:hypothetical protein
VSRRVSLHFASVCERISQGEEQRVNGTAVQAKLTRWDKRPHLRDESQVFKELVVKIVSIVLT